MSPAKALDEGYIAGRNSLADAPRSYCRRVPLRIVASAPQIAVVGSDRETIARETPDAVTGEAWTGYTSPSKGGDIVAGKNGTRQGR